VAGVAAGSLALGTGAVRGGERPWTLQDSMAMKYVVYAPDNPLVMCRPMQN
jgi:hypothetical protein